MSLGERLSCSVALPSAPPLLSKVFDIKHIRDSIAQYLSDDGAATQAAHIVRRMCSLENIAPPEFAQNGVHQPM
jgi:hypothetical protein|tara:strand:+ start:2851 stop:3072 length:222 start_codon:yes stop_codon:yes gene_type:complete